MKRKRLLRRRDPNELRPSSASGAAISSSFSTVEVAIGLQKLLACARRLDREPGAD